MKQHEQVFSISLRADQPLVLTTEAQINVRLKHVEKGTVTYELSAPYALADYRRRIKKTIRKQNAKGEK